MAKSAGIKTEGECEYRFLFEHFWPLTSVGKYAREPKVRKRK